VDFEKKARRTMEMERETGAGLEATVEHLTAAAAALEQAMQRLTERQQESETTIGRISATVEAALEERLMAAEAKIAELEAEAAKHAPEEVTNGRKTMQATMVNMLAKQGVTIDSLDAGALDAALGSLSIEQRIAVKAQLLRAGFLS
jgi:TRAP-type C4-dicarboxylate transport system substrate-binding protein